MSNQPESTVQGLAQNETTVQGLAQSETKQKKQRNVKEKLGRPLSEDSKLKKEIRDGLKFLTHKQLEKVVKSVRKYCEENKPEPEPSGDENENVADVVTQLINQFPPPAAIINGAATNPEPKKRGRKAKTQAVPQVVLQVPQAVQQAVQG